jgi:hypothetical protein
MQMAKCAKKFTNFEENATYIVNIFHIKKYAEIDFQKQAAYLSFMQKKSRVKMLMK